MKNTVNVNIKATYDEYQEERYIEYLNTLGSNIVFDEDKWLCDNLKRNFTDDNYYVTMYFSKVPEKYKDMVKYFAIIRLMQGTGIRSVKTSVFYISDFLKFVGNRLEAVDYNTAMQYKKYLDSLSLSEVTMHGKWSSVNKFLEIMNGYMGYSFKMYFAENPYDSHKKCDYKYIPDTVAERLDEVFYDEDIDEPVRCIYWILRLIPSRINEILNMKIDCLKPFDDHYCLFIPTWKQNGGRREPIMRCIHINDEGIGKYLIELIRNQQELAEKYIAFLPKEKQGALFCYRVFNHMPDGTVNATNQYRVMSWPTISDKFKKICGKYHIVGEDNKIYNLTTHQFRHNGITDRLEQGFTVEQITDMTGHHGSTMLLDAYNHLNLKPETLIKAQTSVMNEIDNSPQYTLFNGRIHNMDEETEKELLKNIRSHKVRGGICSDITGCKSDMMNCLECKFFVPDLEQLEYYKEQVRLWKQKAEQFKGIPMIRENALKYVQTHKQIVDNLTKMYQ